MKSWDSPLNSIRAMAVTTCVLNLFALLMPHYREILVRGALFMGALLVGQLCFHARSMEIKEVRSDAERNRLKLG